MKPVIIICFYTVFAASNCLGQLPCVTAKIQSSVVEKPTEVQSSITSTCDAIKVSWKGGEHQSYILTATYTDVVTAKATAVEANESITCDKQFNCSATLTLKPGATLNWTIQAVQTVDGRTFYSYPLHGESAGCDEHSIVETNTPAKLKAAIKNDDNKLTVHPNPATGELIIDWASEYKGNANLAIMDAAGRPVKVMDIHKEQFNYTQRLAVQFLPAGLYLVYITAINGKSISTRFVKK